MTSHDEEPEFQFRNPITPTAVAYLLRDGKLAKSHLFLLWIIEAFTVYGKGCFASNARLARETRMHPRHISRAISELSEEKLVKVSYKKGVRWLETAWTGLKLERKHRVVNTRTDSQKCEGGLHKNVNHKLLRSSTVNAPRCAAVPDEDNTMPLFKRDDIHGKWADRLRACVRKAGAAAGFRFEKGSWKESTRIKWANEFRLAENKNSPALIEELLRFYEDNCDTITNPKIVNVRHFRKCMESGWLSRLKEEMTKKDVKIDEELKPIIIHLESLGWPKASKKQVGVACQLTFNTIDDFRTRIRRVRKKHWLAKYLLDGGMPTPLGFVEEWMRRVHKRVSDWDDWHGNLLKEVPKPPDDKRFNQWGREIAEEATSAKAWDKLIKEVY